MASKRTVPVGSVVRLGGRVKSARRGKSFRRRVFQESRTLRFRRRREKYYLIDFGEHFVTGFESGQGSVQGNAVGKSIAC